MQRHRPHDSFSFSRYQWTTSEDATRTNKPQTDTTPSVVALRLWSCAKAGLRRDVLLGINIGMILLPKSKHQVSFEIPYCVLPGHSRRSRGASWSCGSPTGPAYHLPAPGKCLRVSQNSNKCLYLGKRLSVSSLQANRITEQTNRYLLRTEVAESDPDIFCYLHPLGWICAKYIYNAVYGLSSLLLN